MLFTTSLSAVTVRSVKTPPSSVSTFCETSSPILFNANKSPSSDPFSSNLSAINVPAVILFALISTASKNPVICPSTIVARSISPTWLNNRPILALSIFAVSMFPKVISAYFRSASSAFKYPIFAVIALI